MKRRRGVTLVELIIALAILVVMAIILIGTLKPSIFIGKSRDTIRKKDLNRIRTSFEEYVNDKGCYPTQAIISNLMEKEYCGSAIFEKWLAPWPCDPGGEPYQIMVDRSNCPKWYKLIAILDNKDDPDIGPIVGVGETGDYYIITSGNISRSDYTGEIDPTCKHYPGDECYYVPVKNQYGCYATESCVGPNCYSIIGCEPQCQVSSCSKFY